MDRQLVEYSAKGGVHRNDLALLVDDGLSIRQIAAELGRSPGSVRYWLEKYGLATARANARRAPRGPLSRTAMRICRQHGHTTFVLEGRGYYRCARCRQERVARWRRQTKDKLAAELGGRCMICGYHRYAGALEFHHLDPSKKEFGLSVRGLTRSIDVLREETSKCVLLCSNCHAEVEGGLTRYSEYA